MSAEIASPIAGGAIPAQNSPLIFPPALRGGIDHWDPLITDGLAESREVILYNGRGVALSSGKPRNRIEDMADDAAAVIRALGLSKVDVLGFEVPPLSWTPKHLCFRSPRCRRNASHTRLSSGGRQSTAQALGAWISVAVAFERRHAIMAQKRSTSSPGQPDHAAVLVPIQYHPSPDWPQIRSLP
jgi:hypothetical protein